MDPSGAEDTSGREARFKNRIAFQTLSERTNDDRGVLLKWPDPLSLPPARDGDWKRGTDVVVTEEPGEAYRVWKFRNERGTLAVEVYVSSTGPATARRRLVELAARTMSVEIPYVPGPKGLGDIAVIHANPQVHRLIWVFHNVCVFLRENDSGVDLTALAMALQQLMERHLVSDLPRRLHRIDGVLVTPERIRVGESVRFDLDIAGLELGAPLLVDIDEKEGRLSYLTEEGTSVRFEAKSPGKGRAVVKVVDRRTLLSASKVVSFDVLSD